MRPSIVLLLVAVVAGGWWFSRGPGGGPGSGDMVGGEGGDFGVSMSQAELAALPPEQRKAIEDAIRNATSPEDFERRMQAVSGQMETQAALQASGVAKAQQYELQDYNQRYSKVNIQGWTVRVAKELTAQSNARAITALTAIDRQLENVVKSLPSERVASLKLVPIWLELKVPGLDVLHYKWAPGGQQGEKDDAIDIPDVQGFLMNVGDQPGMMLHELAHAYHLRALGADNEDIKRAYQAAKAAGLYANVQSITGTPGPAYALTNEKEYFAEITEAYFSRNDFFPFTRDELRTHDPAGHALVEAAWLKR